MSSKNCKLVRIIFRTFDKKIFTNRYNFWTSFMIWLTKIITIPWFYNGLKYDHVEALTPKKQRFSIRMEKGDPFGLNPPIGVYCLNKDGFDTDNSKHYNLEKEERRYKLIFAFEITDKQEKELNNFIQKHLGEKYNLFNANWNVIMNKLKTITFGLSLKFLKDNYNDKSKVSKEWDCVTLIVRALFEIGIIPEYRIPLPGKIKRKQINLLGLSSFDMAKLLLSMYDNGELYTCRYVISPEIQDPEDYKKGIDTFYRIGSKVSRKKIIVEI